MRAEAAREELGSSAMNRRRSHTAQRALGALVKRLDSSPRPRGEGLVAPHCYFLNDGGSICCNASRPR